MTSYDEQQVFNRSPKPVFSADGNWILIFYHSGDSVFYELFDAGSGKQKGPKHTLLFSNSFSFWYPVLSPDGSLLLSAINDSTAQLLKAENGKRHGELIHYHPGWHPQYSPDGKWILVCASDSTAQFVDAETGRKKGNTIKHINSDPVSGWPPLINKDGSRVLTMEDPETFHLWNSDTQKQIKEEIKHESYFFQPAFSPDGKLLLTSDNFGTVRLFDTETGNQKGPALKHPKSEVKEFVFSDNSKKLLIVNLKYAGTDKEEYSGTIWNAVTGKQTGQDLKGLMPNMNDSYEKEANELRFSDDGKFLLYQTSYNGDQLFLNTEAGDLDIPADLLELQILMTSGYKYDFAIDENISVTSKEFFGEAGIKKKYNDKAKKHYAVCKYTKHNLWKRFNEEEAKKIRPDDFQENSKTESVASQFEILPEFQKGDSTIKENNGSFLEPNQAITSKNKKYMLAYQADGNLVIYRKEGMVPIWATDTFGYPAYRTIMQFDGNLVIYSGSPKERGDQAIWASNTWENNANAYLVLEDNGNLVIYNTKNEIVWQSYSIDEVETKKSK
jgi:WD40 repeat protein